MAKPNPKADGSRHEADAEAPRELAAGTSQPRQRRPSSAGPCPESVFDSCTDAQTHSLVTGKILMRQSTALSLPVARSLRNLITGGIAQCVA